MVFSQSNIINHNLLKVVEINSIKSEKVNGTTGNITGGDTDPSEQLPWTTPSFSEVKIYVRTVYLKPEPLFEDTMFNETDCEYFQDLVQWCSDPAKAEPTATDSPKKRDESSHNTDTLHTTFSPQSWDVLDANSPAQAGFYTSTPNVPLSPNMDGITTFDSNFLYNSDIVHEKKIQFLEPNLDILNLPVVLGDLASEEMVDLNPCPAMETFDYYNVNINNNNITQNIEYTPNTYKMFLHTVDEEDSLDMKLGSVVMGEVENRDAAIFNNVENKEETKSRSRQHLSLNMVPTPVLWPSGEISTPEVLSYVEQMEKEKCIPIVIPTTTCSSADIESGFIGSCAEIPSEPSPDFTSVSPKSESHEESDVDDVKIQNKRRKRRNSEDSDETYTPYSEEVTTRKYRKGKSSVPIQEMILALEESQQLPKSRRGRPPKRRASNISSSCSLDDNVSCASTHELKYREVRDKNNVASKRSRMNRKLKELQMEQLADRLEERNKKLKIKADILEDMTKKLKEALMTAIIQKQK